VRKWIVVGLAAAVVVGGSVVYFASSGGSSGSKPLLITATAQKRDLRDEVTVQGTLGRVEQRTINGVNQASQVSKVYLDDGATLTAGESILALDGHCGRRVPVLPEARRRGAGNRRQAARADPERCRVLPGRCRSDLHGADEVRARAVAGRARLPRGDA
jgi:multidrug efflux pump subunit AcrA (membrane-fusion protein)